MPVLITHKSPCIRHWFGVINNEARRGKTTSKDQNKTNLCDPIVCPSVVNQAHLSKFFLSITQIFLDFSPFIHIRTDTYIHTHREAKEGFPHKQWQQQKKNPSEYLNNEVDKHTHKKKKDLCEKNFPWQRWKIYWCPFIVQAV